MWVKALCKGLEHKLPTLLKVPKIDTTTIRPTPMKIDPSKIRRWQMKLIGRGPVNDEKLKPTNQAFPDNSSEYTKTSEKSH